MGHGAVGYRLCVTTPVPPDIATVIGCTDLGPTVDFFRETLGFRIDLISPADSPRVVEMSGHGASVRIMQEHQPRPVRLRLRQAAFSHLASGVVAPNGTIIEFAPERDVPVIPDLVPSLSISRAASAEDFGVGRATMLYRDLIPDRHGGRFIASHIRIDDGGPVPDYVHHHAIRFQMIFCHSGWVEVVYEDQGEPFVMHAGDCVLQPPHIRHRVLKSSAGLEVVEIGCPAEHDTLAEHNITLPTRTLRRTRDFAGQRFVRHIAADATYFASELVGFECRDTGISGATNDLASVQVLRRCGPLDGGVIEHNGELWFAFMRRGSLAIEVGGETVTLVERDSISVPPGEIVPVVDASVDAEFLLVTLPGQG